MGSRPTVEASSLGFSLERGHKGKTDLLSMIGKREVDGMHTTNLSHRPIC